MGLVRLALYEDVLTGDLTCSTVLPPDHRSTARIVAKEPGILSGIPLVRLVLEALEDIDPAAGAKSVTVTTPINEGQEFAAGDVIATFSGPTRAILETERVLLNFLQHLCGIAVAARTYQKAAGPDCKVLDTRKTTPGQRSLEKYAILCGGGSNHRMGLWDAIMIKENHAAAAGGVRVAAVLALDRRPAQTPVIVEVRSLAELELLVDLPLTRVLLDNFRPEQIRAARLLRDSRGATFALEASGGITLATLGDYAQAGAEYVSVGALTHTVKPIDLSLLLEGT